MEIEKIKEYNQKLRRYNEKSAQLKAELTFNINELNKLCTEVSNDLGIKVTPDNLEQVYREYMKKIEETLNTGLEILDRIEQEE